MNREQVLRLVCGLVELRLPYLRMCRPNLYIQDVLELLVTLRMSLHDQIGQMKDNVPMGIRYSTSLSSTKRPTYP